jgi:predicted metal-dependent peptidase
MADLPPNLRRALLTLVIDHEFYAALLLEMRLREIEDKAPPKTLGGGDPKDPGFRFTMGTDGRTVFYSRKFVDSITVPVCVFALVHEVCHPMWQHLTRIYKHGTTPEGWKTQTDSQGRLLMRHPKLWNIAGDYVINLMLQQEGFTLWKSCLVDQKYAGLTTEQVYEKLCAGVQKQAGQGEGEGGEGEPGSQAVPGMGSDLVEPGSEAGSESVPSALEEEWKDRIVRAATIAKQRGKLPASVEGLIAEITEPQYPVWILLQNYVDEVCRDDDYSWHRPHPYFLPQGIIMPGAYSERVSHVCVFYDTSGSVDDESLSRFHRIAGDIIRNANPTLLTLGQCDAGVHSFQEIRSRQDWPSEIKITGRGGTSFKPPFEYLAEKHLQPSLLIYLTDLEGDFPETPPPFPVVWVSTTDLDAPFGQTIHL